MIEMIEREAIRDLYEVEQGIRSCAEAVSGFATLCGYARPNRRPGGLTETRNELAYSIEESPGAMFSNMQNSFDMLLSDLKYLEKIPSGSMEVTQEFVNAGAELREAFTDMLNLISLYSKIFKACGETRFEWLKVQEVMMGILKMYIFGDD